MDHRCPYCGKDLRARRLSQAIVARMEIDCPGCKRRIRTNVHPAESALMLACFGGFVVLGALWYWLKRDGFVVAALVSAMAGTALLPLLEHVWLKDWPRYLKSGSDPDPRLDSR